MFVVLGKDLFVVQISIQNYYWYIETDVPLICACENWFTLGLPFIVSNYSAELLDETGRWHPLRSPVKILQIMNTMYPSCFIILLAIQNNS